MRRGVGFLSATVAIVAVSLLTGGVAAADQAAQLLPLNLRVEGGEENWHADNSFRLDWDRPPIADQGFPVTAVDYRVRNAAGAIAIPEIHLPGDTTVIERIGLPAAVPGIYIADLWLEGPGGARGPQASATLRFDDVRPGSTQPQAPAGWVAGNASALVRLEHPAGPLPTSGIRGYAISVDRGGGSAPCAGKDRCSLAETDLRSGIDGDTISLGILAEGLNVVRAVAVSGSGMRSIETTSATVRVDATRPTVTLSGAPAGWANGPARVVAAATDALSGMAPGGPNGAFTAIAIDDGVPRVSEGSSVAATVAGEGAHTVGFYARDAAGNSGEESPSVAAVRIDESPPSVAFANRQDSSAPDRIEATVSDRLSGPEPMLGSIAVRPAGSRQRFEPLPTAAMPGRLVAAWNGDAFAPGTYELRATGFDRAGNLAASDRRANGTRMVLTNPPKAATELELGFGGRRLFRQHCAGKAEHRRCRREETKSFAGRPRTLAVPYAHGVALGGRLSLASGARLDGLPVQVVETFRAGSEPQQRTQIVETGADGTFVAHLAPGPDRQVEAVFAGNRVLGRTIAERARLEVLAGVRMHASAAIARVGGAPLVFGGRVGALGAPIPAGGVAVELQFRLPGGDWSQFRTVQTDARGGFRYPYAFSDDDSRGVSFQFRAYVPAQDWPYRPAGSKPVSVTGR